MRLHEYQAKRILSQYGVPVPRGEVAISVDEVHRIASRLGRRVVLKAQVLVGGRGQAGGIHLANDADEAKRLAGQMLGMHIAGYTSSKLLVDEAIQVDREIYVGIAIDRRIDQPTLVASAQGGVEISEIARDTPEHVHRVPIDPLLGLRAYQARVLADDVGLDREQIEAFVPIALGLYQAFADCDATLVEANPLVIGPDGNFCCLNSKVVVDDHALFRHPDLVDMRDESQDTLPERLARGYGITYVRLGGSVGCLSNGAGLAMATVDLLRSYGVRPANLVDIGKSGDVDKVLQGLRLARTNSVEAVGVSMFCNLTRCDEVAQSIVRGCQELDVDVPVVVYLQGLDWRKGHALLDAALEVHRPPCIYRAASLGDLVDRVVALVEHSRQEGHGE